MTVKQLFDTYYNGIKGLYDDNEARAIAETVMEDFYGIGRIRIYSDGDRTIEADENVISKNLEKLRDYCPVQYLIGKTLFYDRVFEVDCNVLIPRNETEELVREILLSDYPESPEILDIGCGSGAIGVTLALEIPASTVTCADISEGALAVAKRNAALHNARNVEFIIKDILATEELRISYDIIVSNPPYVRECEKRDMHDNVLLYEPHTALFVKDSDPLVFYEKISSLAAKGLKNGGALFFEINEHFGAEIGKMLVNKGFTDVRIKKDLNGKDRMATAIWKRK